MSYYNGPRIVTDGLVLYVDPGNHKSYPGSGTTGYDLALSSTINLQNGVGFNNNNIGSFSLDGSNDRILINCIANTIRCYNSTTQFIVKLPTYGGGQRCILSYRDGFGGNMYIGKNSGGIFIYYNELNNPGYTAGTIADNSIVMCHVVCNTDLNMLYLYINGQIIGSGVSRTGWVTAYNQTLYLGYDHGGTNEYMIGNFYQFAHYNKVLSGSEILQNYNALKSRFNL